MVSLEPVEERVPDTFRPTTNPPPPSFVAGPAGRFATAFVLTVLIAGAALFFARPKLRRQRVAAQGVAGLAAAFMQPISLGERADGALARQGRTSVPGGLLMIPPSFESADGAYDLVLHFHGNVDLVEESFAVAKTNAVLVIFNVGVSSGSYQERFGSPAAVKEILERIRSAVEKRGLTGARQRRLALSAWSAGYGAVVSILDQSSDAIDAILLFDGFHASYVRSVERIDALRIRPFERFARRAMEGRALLAITHSQIETYEYASTRVTTDALLAALGVTRGPAGARPEIPALSSFHGIPKEKVMPLNSVGEVHAGGFHVRGYAGGTRDDHAAHLLYMASIGLGELVERWSKRPDP